MPFQVRGKNVSLLELEHRVSPAGADERSEDGAQQRSYWALRSNWLLDNSLRNGAIGLNWLHKNEGSILLDWRDAPSLKSLAE